jgi:two-component system nitrogen regulation response regulator GlnG
LGVWVVDRDPATRWTLERALAVEGMSSRAFDTVEQALKALEHDSPDVMLTEIQLPGRSGLELVRAARASHAGLPVIVTAGNATLNSAVAAYKAGAFEYLPKPFDILEALSLIKRAGRARPFTSSQRDPSLHISEMLGRAPCMQPIFRAIGRLATTSVTVLLKGEPGTGKELVARALHYHSPRAGGPFVIVDTRTIPEDLLEVELFGSEQGTPAGTLPPRRGQLEQADGGTVLLNDIANIPAPLQSRLLRVLAQGEFHRVGGHTPVRTNIRLIGATQEDLHARVQLGLFRGDLYYRLNALEITLPPLRKRPEDVAALLRYHMEYTAGELGIQPKCFAPATLNRLANYEWPGNLRELADLCRRLCALSPGSEVGLADLPAHLRPTPPGDPAKAEWTQALAAWSDRKLALGEHPLFDIAEAEFHRVLMSCALTHAQGSRSQAAKIVGMSRNTLARRSRELTRLGSTSPHPGPERAQPYPSTEPLRPG